MMLYEVASQLLSAKKNLTKRKVVRITITFQNLTTTESDNMECIACGRETRVTAIMAGAQAAFCHYHYPVQQNRIHVIITVKC